MKLKFTLCIFIIVAIALFYFFFFFLPYNLYSINDLEKGRNYFTAVAAYTNFIFGILGTIFGMFYYFDKRKKEEEHKLIENKRQKVNLLLSEIKDYDQLVEHILCSECSNDNDLTLTRKKIERRSEDISMIINNYGTLIQLDDQDISNILSVHSFVQKNNPLMHNNIDSQKRSDLDSIRDEYVELIKIAKNVCFEKAK